MEHGDVAWRRVLRLDQAFRESAPRGEGVAVAVIDSGCRVSHRQLAGRISARLNASGNASESAECMDDPSGHGTHVAGLIAGLDTGVAPAAKIVPIRVLDGSARGEAELLVRLRRALRWLLEEHAGLGVAVVCLPFCQLSNRSARDSAYDEECEALIRELRSRGVLTVAPAGNFYTKFARESGLAWPAVLPEVLAVGASVAEPADAWEGSCSDGRQVHRVRARGLVIDQLAPFSQRCPDVGQLFAPGIRIPSAGARSDGRIEPRWGTSQACALVAGLIAWLQSHAIHRDGAILKPDELLAAVKRGAVTIRDGEVSYARVDAVGALRALD